MKKGTIILLLLVLGGVVIFSKGRMSGTPVTPAMEGYYAPEFSLPLLTGENTSLSRARGKVVLVNIWATWCKPCLDEMSSLEALYRKKRDRGLEILAVSIDKGGADVVERFVKKLNLSFPILLDPTGSVGQLYGITGVPESFLVSRKGMIVEKVVGPRDWLHPHSLMTVESLLNEKA